MIIDSIELNGEKYLDIGTYGLYGPRLNKGIMHLHHYLEISILKSGYGHYVIGDREYEINPGDIFIINNTESHGIKLQKNEKLNNLVIHFSPQFIWSSNNLDLRYLAVFFERSKTFSNKLDPDNPCTEKIRKIFYELEEEFNNKTPEYYLMAKVKLLNILTLLLRHYNYTENPNTKISKNHQIHIVDKVTEYINLNFSEQIPMSDLGDIAHMHPSYLSSIFKKYHGISPKEYIIRRRIALVVDCLKKSNKTILDIATSCGFNNMTNFYKTFRKITGKSPSYYRNNTSISGYTY